jgi:hypothetical protein
MLREKPERCTVCTLRAAAASVDCPSGLAQACKSYPTGVEGISGIDRAVSGGERARRPNYQAAHAHAAERRARPSFDGLCRLAVGTTYTTGVNDLRRGGHNVCVHGRIADGNYKPRCVSGRAAENGRRAQHRQGSRLSHILSHASAFTSGSACCGAAISDPSRHNLVELCGWWRVEGVC